jgi:hypothetical protein
MGLFRKQPAALTTLLFANVLVSLLLSSLPLVGQLTAVLIPSLSMSFMQACAMLSHGQRVPPAVLLTGFRKPAVFTLIKIGVAYLLVTSLVTVLARVMLSDEFWKQAASSAGPTVLSGSDALAVLVMGVLHIATIMALSFAAPLACWQHMTAGKSIFYSFFAVLRSLRAFMVMLLAWFGLFMVTAMVPLILLGNASFGRVLIAWLSFLFVLLLQCGVYAAYCQIFGEPERPPEAKPRA